MSIQASAADIGLLSTCAFLGTIGASLTGFGQAIIFLFVWQIVELAGYNGDFKSAVFIQALSLFSMQPLILYKAKVWKNAYRRVLLLFVPITLVSTPIGQLVSDGVPTNIVQAVAGVLVTFVACWELYCKRVWLMSLIPCINNASSGAQEGKDGQTTAGADDAAEKGEGKVNDEVKEETTNDNNNETSEEVAEETFADDGVVVTNDCDVEETPKKQDENESKTPSSEAKTAEEQLKFGINKPTLITLLAGGASGFLGGLVAIRGPPLIFYFLHPPHPISFNKSSQRATGVVIMFCNVLMRMIFYLVNTFSSSSAGKRGFVKEDWRLYLSVVICSVAGGLVGSKMFEYLKDSKNTIRGILAVFLLLCGVSLLFSAFA